MNHHFHHHSSNQNSPHNQPPLATNIQRMGILIQPPPPNLSNQSINWAHAVVGMFFDNSPPNSSFVFNIVNNHWETRAPIRVFRTGPYFILECQNPNDRDAILFFNTSFMDGKPITFRPCSATQIPTSINFNMGRIWVRVHDLPWGCLNTDWTVRILSHVGLIEAIENHGVGLPTQPFLRAKIIIDLTQPLIPGCFLPTEGDRVSWVFFRYEGVFRFCKECGCIGHNTGRCNLSAFDATRIIQRRVRELERDGMMVLQTHSGIPLYTNMIRGLNDRFLHRNPRLNLTQIHSHMEGPQYDPYLYPHLYLHDHGETDSSPEDYYDATPDFQRHNMGPHDQYYSDENSQNHTNPPPDFSNASLQNRTPIRWEENVTPSPGRRFGLSPDPGASISWAPNSPQSYQTHIRNNIALDLNMPPDLNTPAQPEHQDTNSRPTPTNQNGLFHQLGISNWVHKSSALVRSLCGGKDILRQTTQPLSPHDENPIPPNTLEGLVLEGWALVPPGPQEAGPSNWVDRAQEQALTALQGEVRIGPITPHMQDISDSSLEPDEFHHISLLINERFRISPPPIADVFNPLLQGHQTHQRENIRPYVSDEIYSPTSPLEILQVNEMSSPLVNLPYENTHVTEPPRALTTGNPVLASMFMGKRRRDDPSNQSQSLDSFFRFGNDEFEARMKRQKRRMEEWDAKGGFTIFTGEPEQQMRSKAITDVDMAMAFGVHQDTSLGGRQRGKRNAGASPQQQLSLWSQKKSKGGVTGTSHMGDDNLSENLDMAVHLSLAVGNSQEGHDRDVVDPNQPRQSP